MTWLYGCVTDACIQKAKETGCKRTEEPRDFINCLVVKKLDRAETYTGPRAYYFFSGLASFTTKVALTCLGWN